MDLHSHIYFNSISKFYRDLETHTSKFLNAPIQFICYHKKGFELVQGLISQVFVLSIPEIT